MGLDELIPDDADTTSRSSSGKSSQKEFEVEVGSGQYEKKFTEERWEDIKRVLINEFGEKPNQVLNYPSERRFNILHEAALVVEGKDVEETEFKSKTRCDYCGKACDDSYVEIDGKKFHTNHTVAQIEDLLEDG